MGQGGAESGDGQLNSQHRAIRAILKEMSTKRAIGYICAFELPEVEEYLLIECDIRKRSYASLYQEGYTESVIKSAKRRAYHRIADELNYRCKER